MASVGTIRRIWRGGEHDFCLAATGDLLLLEELTNSRLADVLHRLVQGYWGVRDVREPIRLGLIGAGMEPERAMALVKASVDENPAGLAPSAILARDIVQAVVIGVPGEEIGKKKPARAAAKGNRSSVKTAGSGAPPSSESARA